MVSKNSYKIPPFKVQEFTNSSPRIITDNNKILSSILHSIFKPKECASVKLLVLSDSIHVISVYGGNGFLRHDLEMVLKL